MLTWNTLLLCCGVAIQPSAPNAAPRGNSAVPSSLRWSFLKLASTRRLSTACSMRSCRCQTSACWRPRAAATPTAALTAKRRRGRGALSFASASVGSTSRDTAPTTTGRWATESADCLQPWGALRLKLSILAAECSQLQSSLNIAGLLKVTSLHSVSYETHTIRAQIICRADVIFIISIFHLPFWATGVVVDVWILLPSLKRVLTQSVIQLFSSLFKSRPFRLDILGTSSSAVSMATTTAVLHLFWRWNNGTFTNWIWTLATVRSIKQRFTCI